MRRVHMRQCFAQDTMQVQDGDLAAHCHYLIFT